MSEAAFIAGLRGDATACGAAPARRLAVYRNNIAAAAVAALAVRYPVTRQLVGNAFFAAMVGDFARAHPPRSALLIRFGGGLPEFIAGFEPAGGVPSLADVARLERAWWEAYHAADASALAAAAFAALPAAALPDLRLAFHPAAALVPSPWPIVSIWRAHKRGGDMAGIDLARPETALVARPGFDVAIDTVPAAQAHLLTGLMRGESLGVAAEAALAAFPELDLAGALARLVASGIVTSIARGESACAA